MTPEQEDEFRSMIQGLEDRARDTTDAVCIQTDMLSELLETVIDELRKLGSEIKEARPCVHSEKLMKQ